MTTPVLICDDSTVARKQMARSLPDNWDVDISFAEHGEDGLKALKAGKGDILFLDLNMPVMDGYAVLEAICKQDIPTMVIVVSGDIQPEARERVKRLGAIDFIKKPVEKEQVAKILTDYGLYSPMAISGTESNSGAGNTPDTPQQSASKQKISQALASMGQVDLRDCVQELANVAMGQAADLLARLLNVFVVLPIPKVNYLEVSELEMALSISTEDNTYSAVCQGFIGSGIAGEALLIFSDSSFTDMAKLVNYTGEINSQVELELLMEVASILIGACTNGIAHQLDIAFSVGHPMILGQHINVSELIRSNAGRWKKTMTIEITYAIENYDISCDLLLLLTEDSMDSLERKASYLLAS
ncbi:MAG: response regulator [Pseudomonadales bacterium]|nr:response regulator [Pseudomonadales bacterium]